MTLEHDFTDCLDSLRVRIARSMLYLPLLWTTTTYSQRATSFGPTIDLALSYAPVGLSRSSVRTEIAVLAQDPPSVVFYTVTPTATLLQTDLVPLSNPVQEIVAESGDKGEVVGFATLSTDGDKVFLIQRQSATPGIRDLFTGTSSQHIAFGDINSDKRTDMLLFGKRRTGISPLLKQKNGSYVAGAMLFPDLSIGDLRCADFNGDNISDLILLDWLANKLVLFYGIGHGVFSEQVGVDLPGEPGRMAISPMTKDRIVRIAVSIPEERLVALFRCNATGEIEPMGVLRFESPPSRLCFEDITRDKELDLIVSTDQSIVVFPGLPKMRFGSPTLFGAGSQVAAFEILDLDGDSNKDLVVIDGGNKRVVAYGNASWSGTVAWPAVYAVGNAPQGIAPVDVNGDGLLDLIVANSGSSTLSVLLNRGAGQFDGQQAISLADQPLSVKAVGWLRSSNTLLASHPRSDRISIIRMSADIIGSNVSTFPTGASPHVVLADQDSVSDNLEILARYSTTEGLPSLSFFRQIASGQLVERNIRASLGGRMTALTVDDFSGAGKHELVFVTHEKATRQSTISIAAPSADFEFKIKRPLISFPDSTGCVHSLTTGYVDEDRFRDILVIMSRPRNALGILYGKGGGTFRDTLDILPNIQLLDEDALMICDANSDGYPDLTWIDVAKTAVLTRYGKGGRRYEQAATICPAVGVTSFQIANIKSPKAQDLILTNGSKGTLTLKFDPFR